jgi:ribosomal-protein-alanine N-acetyltransferase
MAPPDPKILAALHAKVTAAPWSVQSFAGLLAGPSSVIVARSTGFALGRIILDEAELLQIAVDPAHHRKGLGKALLAGFESEACERGATRLLLEVAATNAPARALYATSGWREDGLRKGYYKGANGHREDAVLMSKTP